MKKYLVFTLLFLFEIVSAQDHPTPAITNMTATTCSSTDFTALPINGTNGVIPAGTTYTWEAPVVTGGVTGGVANVVAATSITGTLTNPTYTAQTATYTVTPSAAGYAGSTFTVTITVNPTPASTSVTASICNAVNFAITASGLVPSGTTYSWAAPIVTGGLTGGTTGTAAANINGTLTNPTNAAQTATYTVTPRTESCIGSNFTVTLTVSPTPEQPIIEVLTHPTCANGSGSIAITNYNASYSYYARLQYSPYSTVPLFGAMPAVPEGTYTVNVSGENYCSSVSSSSFTINTDPHITPTFTIASPLCAEDAEDALGLLPTTSNNGVTGTWVLDNWCFYCNGINPLMWTPYMTCTYTFTPDPGQCANSKTITIQVYPKDNPTFASIASICVGDTLTALPTRSTNYITGTWSPALNNTTTTTYTFTPNTGQCAMTTTKTIVVNPKVIPTFDQVSPICMGNTLADLPVTSTNGITGSWSPALNNTATTTYTFTPTAGQCATTTTMTITVNPIATPTFTGVSAICFGATPVALPTISNNGITGTWSPALNNTTTTTYTFTPSAGQCASSATMTITVIPTNTIILSSGAGTNNKTLCINNTLTAITFNTTGATGATVTWLPAGTTGSWNNNVVTISGIPSVSGSFPYTVTLTGGCGTINATGTITVNANTYTLTSSAGTNNQTLCKSTLLTPITYTTTGATNATVTGLPSGVTKVWSNNVLTISGTPTVTGTFNYTATLTGGCPVVTTGSITVNPTTTGTLSSGTGTNDKTLCINSTLTNITFTTVGITGSSQVTVSGLPTGVIGSWDNNIVTISGVPTQSGSFPYTVTLSGDCGIATKTGTITVNPTNTITLTSATETTNQTVCKSSVLTTITYATTGATNATVTGLPTGVTKLWTSNVLTISGTPSATGTFNYTVTLTGGCGTTTTTGTITVIPTNTATFSGQGTSDKTLCINTPLTGFTYTTTGATGATVTGLPMGVTGSWAADVVTINGTPTETGFFTTTVTLTGGCGIVTKTGTIKVNLNTITLTSAAGTQNQTKCINTAITNITYATTGATNATVTGLPTGVTKLWSSNVLTISGTPTVSGTYPYTVTLTGGCGIVTTTGTITVGPNTLTLTSSAGTTNQTLCMNNTLTDITYATTGATGATFSGLPAGVTGTWANNRATINGTPTIAGTFGYTVTLIGGCGALTANGTITVNPIVTSTFLPVSAICSGSSLANLPTISIEGVAGTWSPALNNTATTTYTFTPIGQCANTAAMTITVNPIVTPNFTTSSNVCYGADLIDLPTTSLEGITGTWLPELNSTDTTIYTFTPDTGQCATIATHTITVDPSILPTFTEIAPICSGESLIPLPTTSLEGITGSWSPDLDNTITTIYTFTPDANQCASVSILEIAVNPIIPTFTAIEPICSGTPLNNLPTTSINGITGTWSPELDNTQTTIYTFTPAAGQCASVATLIITVDPNVPTFTTVDPICLGGYLSDLPTTSLEGITGTWSPALDNTTTTEYTFTPDAGQCASVTALSITVNPIITPTFTTVTSICFGDDLSELPIISTEGITGTWSPDLDNTVTTTYTFTPDAGQCATMATLTIVVNTTTVSPTFEEAASICAGGNLNSLPTTSLNGITGTWSPDLNNTSTTTYTFTPDAGQCATTAFLTILVNEPAIPVFSEVAPIEVGDSLNDLPTTSNDGITGTWSPALDNTITTTYVFTPTTGQCATYTTLTIEVIDPTAITDVESYGLQNEDPKQTDYNTFTLTTQKITPTFDPVGPICSGWYTAAPLPTSSKGGITGTWYPSTVQTQMTTTYKFTPTDLTNYTTATLTIEVIVTKTPTFKITTPLCVDNILSGLPAISENGIAGTWYHSPNYDPNGLYRYLYDFFPTPKAGLCANPVDLYVPVKQKTIPTFKTIAPIYEGGILSALPTTSLNGITGTWSPALNNLKTTTYTFTPNTTPTGQCADIKEVTIVVNPKITPTFNEIAPVYSGSIIKALPTTSTNGIVGTWSPALNNTATTTYTFTPNAANIGKATITTLTVEVLQHDTQPVPPVNDFTIDPFPVPHFVPRPISITDTKGELSVSGSGTATYKVPIALPPGIRDIAPQLALVYGGSSVQGVAGMGWNLVGISSISRTSSRLDLDSVIDPVDFDALDRFSLDGQRLIATANSYGLPGTTYRTENYSNLKIDTTGNFVYPGLTNPSGPKSFTVTFPDGTQAFYGGTPDSRGLSEWMINRWIDPQGNYIDYTYESEKNVTRIKQISWGKNINAASTYENSIEINYKNRIRSEYSYISGIPMISGKIISYVIVKTGGDLFRTYTLEHETISGNYQRVKYIVESNGNNEIANPIYFDYNNRPDGFGPLPETKVSPKIQLSDVLASGDFDGDGNLDFLAKSENGAKQSFYLNPLSTNSWSGHSWSQYFDNTDDQFCSATSIYNNKLNQKNSIVQIREKVNGTSYTIYSLSPYNATYNLNIEKQAQYNKVFTSSHITPQSNCTTNINTKSSIGKYITGDFDGDGVTEIIGYRPIVEESCVKTGAWVNTKTTTGYSTTILDLKDYSIKEITNFDQITNVLISLGEKSDSSQPSKLSISTADFNGDGRTDILTMNLVTNEYKIYQFNKQKIQIELLFSGIFEEKLKTGDDNKQFVFGDFNGDSKMDIMIPEANGSARWHMHISTGIGFKETIYDDFEFYQPSFDGPATARRTIRRSYTAADLDKDGKSDFVINEYESHTILSWSGNQRIKTNTLKYKQNIGDLTSQPLFASNKEISINPDEDNGMTFLAGDIKTPKANSNIVLIQAAKIWKGSYQKDISEEATLVGIREANNNISQTICYKTLEPSSGNNGLGTADDTYSSSNAESYPYTEMIKIPSLKIVDKVTVSAAGQKKYQSFKYSGLVVHSQGLGVLGFKKTAQSSWFSDSNSDKIWSCSQMDPKLFGQKIYTWSYSGDVHTSFATLPLTTSSPTDLSISTHSYTTSLLGNGIKIIVPTKTETKDFLTGVNSKMEYWYDAYWNINRTLSTNPVGTKEVVNTMNNDNPSGIGKLYALGRITKINTTLKAYGDTFTTEETFDYDPQATNLVKSSQKKGYMTNPVTEAYEHDIFGNVTKKTISAPDVVASRSNTDRYDDNGRFVVEKTDNDGFVTAFEYNKLGQVTQSTNYLGVVSVTNYDNWGMLTGSSVTGASSGTQNSSVSYQRFDTGSLSVTNTNLVTSEASRSFQDVFGRNVKTTTKGFAAGSWISKSTEYDDLGRKIRVSEPYFDSQSDSPADSGSKWNTVTYDYLSRPVAQETYNGRKVTSVTPYGSLTTTSTDGPKTTEVTVDANGNKIKLIDNSETLQYTYYANGKPKQYIYGNYKITMKYDGWGNQIYILDPSVNPTIASTATYNSFGELLTSTSSLGTTTIHYTDKGRVNDKTSIGQNTNLTSVFEYNAKGLVSKETGSSNGKSFIYTYNYNGYWQLMDKTEEMTGDNLTHKKAFTYDGQGRVLQETTNSYLTNNLSVNNGNNIIEYGYNSYNGLLEQFKEIPTGTVLWKLNTANEKMKALTASLGNGMQIANTYDEGDYVKTINHSSSNVVALNLEYEFVRDRGTLTKRKNTIASVLSWEETFGYDSFERLTSWSDPTGTAYNNYESDGRISENSAVGTYYYDPANRYRKKSAILNDKGKALYTTRSAQTAIYNMFKNPISATETTRGSVNFEYNSSAGRSKSIVLAEGGTVIKNKYYSEISEVEIIEKPNQTLQFITYLAGSPYDAPVALEKTYTVNGTNYTPSTQEYLYLHRDYQGTILAISGDGGVVKERRQFDPWGVLKKCYKGTTEVNATTLGGVNFDLLTDRGYTGHEHFFSLGIIHMNGRIYDPVLRSFLSPDPALQDPGNSQNYNRYSYCVNNPLLYTDPSGAIFGIDDAIYSAIVIAAIISAVTYSGMAIYSGTFSWGGLAKNIVIGAVSGAATFGIGEIASTIKVGEEALSISSQILRGTAQAAMHGVMQGAIAGISGGDFAQGFVSGALASVASSAFAFDGNGAEEHLGWASGVRESKVGLIAFGTVSGGVGAALTGGNFWQGAAIGLIVSGLNHAMNHMDSEDGVAQPKDINETTTSNEKPYVLNQSKKTIYYKPEETAEALPLGPGQKTYDLVDGINVGGKVYKVSNGYTSVTVKANFRVYMDYSKSGIIQAYYALYKGGLVTRSDFNKNDHGWDNLFNIKK